MLTSQDINKYNHTCMCLVTIGSLVYIRVQINPELYVQFVLEGIIIVLQVANSVVLLRIDSMASPSNAP